MCSFACKRSFVCVVPRGSTLRRLSKLCLCVVQVTGACQSAIDKPGATEQGIYASPFPPAANVSPRQLMSSYRQLEMACKIGQDSLGSSTASENRQHVTAANFEFAPLPPLSDKDQRSLQRLFALKKKGYGKPPSIAQPLPSLLSPPPPPSNSDKPTIFSPLTPAAADRECPVDNHNIDIQKSDGAVPLTLKSVQPRLNTEVITEQGVGLGVPPSSPQLQEPHFSSELLERQQQEEQQLRRQKQQQEMGVRKRWRELHNPVPTEKQQEEKGDRVWVKLKALQWRPPHSPYQEYLMVQLLQQQKDKGKARRVAWLQSETLHHESNRIEKAQLIQDVKEAEALESPAHNHASVNRPLPGRAPPHPGISPPSSQAAEDGEKDDHPLPPVDQSTAESRPALATGNAATVLQPATSATAAQQLPPHQRATSRKKRERGDDGSDEGEGGGTSFTIAGLSTHRASSPSSRTGAGPSKTHRHGGQGPSQRHCAQAITQNVNRKDKGGGKEKHAFAGLSACAYTDTLQADRSPGCGTSKPFYVHATAHKLDSQDMGDQQEQPTAAVSPAPFIAGLYETPQSVRHRPSQKLQRATDRDPDTDKGVVEEQVKSVSEPDVSTERPFVFPSQDPPCQGLRGSGCIEAGEGAPLAAANTPLQHVKLPAELQASKKRLREETEGDAEVNTDCPSTCTSAGPSACAAASPSSRAAAGPFKAGRRGRCGPSGPACAPVGGQKASEDASPAALVEQVRVCAGERVSLR